MMLFLLLVCYFLNQFLKLSANIVIPIYQVQFGLSSGISGLISSMFFVPYAFMQVASGPLCNKYGPGRFVGAGMIVSGFGLLSMAVARNAFGIVVARFLMGLGFGTVFVCVIHHIAHKFTGKAYVTVSALALSVSSFGSASAAAPLKFMIARLGIFYTLMSFSILSFILAVLFFIISKKPENSSTQSKGLFKEIGETLKYIFSSRDLVIGMLIWVTYICVQMTYQGLWCTKWTATAFPSKESLSGLAGTVLGFGLMLGCFFGKYVKPAKYTFGESTLLHGIFFTISLAVLCLINMTEFFWCSIAANSIYGFFCGSICTHDTAYCREASSTEQNASVIGIWNCLASLAVVVYQWGSGILVDAFENTKYPFTWTHLIMGATFVIVLIFAFIGKKKAS